MAINIWQLVFLALHAFLLTHYNPVILPGENMGHYVAKIACFDNRRLYCDDCEEPNYKQVYCPRRGARQCWGKHRVQNMDENGVCWDKLPDPSYKIPYKWCRNSFYCRNISWVTEDEDFQPPGSEDETVRREIARELERRNEQVDHRWFG